jgi:PrcB C-terminal
MATVRLRPRLKRLCLLGVIGGLSLLLLAGAVVLWAQGDAARVLGQGEWANVPPDTGAAGREPRVLAVRSQQDLYRALGVPGDGKSRMQMERFITDAFNTKKVDFEARMLLLVVAGTQPSRGYRVEVTRVERDREGKALRVHWKLHPPPAGPAVAPVPTHPAAVVLLKRFDGEVKLEAPAGGGQEPPDKTKS